MKGETINRADVAASFQKAVVEALVTRAISLAKETGMNQLAVAGGVASNSALRKALSKAFHQPKGTALVSHYSFWFPYHQQEL